MNVFLQGLPGVGKSTIIKKILRELSIDPTGFFTLVEELPIEGKRNIYIHPANSKNLERESNNLIGESVNPGKLVAYTKVFENYGLEILSHIESPLIIMDEIGFLEDDAYQYQSRILDLLNQEIMILGVIKKKETPFISTIARHRKSIVIEVNENNREEAYFKSRTMIMEALGRE